MTRGSPSARSRRPVAALAALTLLAAACDGDDPGGGGAAGDGVLDGLLAIEDGQCDDEGVTSGSSFRMVQPGGDLEEGPFVDNGDSPCGDPTWTPLAAGRDGGLLLGEHQGPPDEPFAEDGHARAGAIIAPQAFFAVDFAVTTGAVDPQTELEVPVPQLEVDEAGDVTGQTTAWAVGWNRQFFNQGAPKPDGELPGMTSAPEGTYDPATGEITVSWTSAIVGGPFDGFTGLWHLEGRIEPID